MEMKNNTHNSGNMDNIQKVAPILFEIDKSNPFQVPGDYFEDLPSRIQQNAGAERVSIISRFQSWIYQHPKYSVSYGISLVIAIVFVIFVSWPDHMQSYSFAEITIEDVLEGSPEIIYDLTESQIIDILLVDNEMEVDVFSTIDILFEDSLTREDLIEYLNSESFETELLYNL